MRFYLIYIFVFVISCKKQQNDLPEITNEGKNTIGFVDSQGETFGGKTHLVDYNSIEQILSIVFLKTKRVWSVEYEWRLNLKLKYDQLIDSFKFQDASYHAKLNDFAIDSLQYNSFEIIYYDKTNRILSGIFDLNMAAVNSSVDTTYLDTAHTEKIKSGRFDICYP